jgi:prepilin-type N-terminal cleavage/methylation domain-containing protein
MKTIHFGASHKKHFGFTLVELLVVIATLAVLVGLLLPALAQTNRRSLRMQCVNNLKLINLSVHVWEGDYFGKYPTAVSTANGGAMESIASQTGGYIKTNYAVANVFLVMSNRLGTPKVLACPADTSRTSLPGDTYSPTSPTGPTGPILTAATNWENFSVHNLSYFVEGNASDAFPQMILIGDRNIGHQGAVAETATPASKMDMVNGPYTETFVLYPGVTGLSAITRVSWLGSSAWEWTDTDIHQDVGNLGMADGSVQQTPLGGLQYALFTTELARGNGPPPMHNVILNMP